MNELLLQLKKAVADYRAAKAAYHQWYDDHRHRYVAHGGDNLQKEELHQEVILRTQLGHHEREIHRLALLIADL